MMLDLGDDAPRRRPALRLVLETLVADQRLATRTSPRAEQDLFDRQLQGLVGGDANGIRDIARFQPFVDLGLGEGRGGAKRDMLACRLLTLDLWDEQLVPVVGAVDVAWPQLCGQTIALVIEQKQRMVADRLEVPVVGTAFLLPMHWTLAGI